MLPAEAETVLKNAEYISQALNFTPQSFGDTIYNTLYEYTVDGMTALQNAFKEEFSDLITDESELTKGTNKVLNHFLLESRKTFAKLDGYLIRYVFHLPDTFVFPEDEIQLKLDASEANERKLDEEIEKTLQEIKEQKTMFAHLKREEMILNKTLSEYSKTTDLFQKLIDAAKKRDITCVDDIENVGAEINKRRKLMEN